MMAHNITVEDSSPLIIYSSGWVDSPHGAPDYDKYSGYSTPDFASSHQTNASASFDFAFNGTAIYVFGTQSSLGGPFSVVLTDTDTTGTSINTVDSSSGTSLGSTAVYQSLLYSHTGLKAGTPHSIHLANGGQGLFAFDFIIVQNEIGSSGLSVQNVTFDDADPAFTYSGGSWNESLADPNAPSSVVTKFWSNGDEHTTSDIGATAKFEFPGSGVEIHGTWSVGNVSIMLDGQLYANVSSHVNITGGLYNRPRELIWFADGLNEGNHTVEVTNLGFVSKVFGVDAFSIDYAVIYTVGTSSNGTSSPVNTTSGGAGAQQTSHGHATMLLPYNAALLVVLFWIMARVRLF